MLARQLEYLEGAELAGVVLGARAPIVLTSRARLGPRAVYFVRSRGSSRCDHRSLALIAAFYQT
jgi:phosphate acetyltransferase/phosphate butyryltransferase